MKSLERIEKMLAMEQRTSEKDAAGIYNPSALDSSIKARVLKEVIKVLKDEKHVSN